MKPDLSQIELLLKKSKKAIRAIKTEAVSQNLLELAANIREIEIEAFPETEEQKAAKEYSNQLNLLFRMVDLDVPNKQCWIIGETLKAFQKKKSKFDLLDAVKLKEKAKELFD